MSGVRLPRGADCGRAIALLVRVVSGLRVRLDVRTVNAVEAAIAEYEPRAAAGDPIAQAQLHRLRRARRRTAGAGGERPPSRWAHVPLAALFEAHGNALRERRDGSIVCGHEPFHRSRSGTCVVLWPDSGRYWCRSCGERGDAATFTQRLTGSSYREAAEQLATEYGEPAATANASSQSDGEPAAPKRRGQASQSTRLLRLIEGGRVALLHTPEGAAYAAVPVVGHTETLRLRSAPFRQWLARGFYGETGQTPNAQALADAVTTLEGRALFDAPAQAVYVRRAELDGALYIDIGTPGREAVAVDAGGWRIVPGDAVPVRFIRPRGLLPLPTPVRGGTLDALRRFVNVGGDDDLLLVAGWLAQAMRGTGPYPVLPLTGEQGSGKSTAARVLRALVDPNVAPIRAEPREPRDLMIAATNGAIVALDNLSRLTGWLSDALCRLATGGGFGARELYSDDEERLFDAMRPIILTGIEEFVTEADLLDRVVFVHLHRLTEPRTEAALWQEFGAAAPALLGVILDGVSRSLRDAGAVDIRPLPRMADFALNAAAAMPAFARTAEQFIAAYTQQRRELADAPLDAAPIWPALRALLAELGRTGPLWQGTATELLDELGTRAGEAATRRRGWPANGRALANALRRLTPALRSAGYELLFARRHGGERVISITSVTPAEREEPSVTRVTTVTATPATAATGDASPAAGDAATAPANAPASPATRRNRAIPCVDGSAGDAGDAGDAGNPRSSATAAESPEFPSCWLHGEPLGWDGRCRWCASGPPGSCAAHALPRENGPGTPCPVCRVERAETAAP